MATIEKIISHIDSLPSKHFQKLIGVDGLGASGKTTLAEAIKKAHSESSIIHTDEFYLPKADRSTGVLESHVVSPDFDWDRFENQVIKPIRRNLLVKYERYDWRADQWDSWIEIPATHWIIIVGVYALQSRFFSAYDYTIWMDVPREERIKRMIEREGEAVANEWLEKWSPREENYWTLEGPDKRASIVL